MYSQYFEETFILKTLRDEPAGRFLDIGCWNAKVFSNTRALFELGWGGILIEPSPGPVQALVREYGNCERVKVIAAAVAVEAGLIELAVTDDAVSQPVHDSQRIDAWRAAAGFYGNLTVPALSVHDVFRQYGGDFGMVSIDTEGTSVSIFAEMCRLGPRPRCVVVEHDSRFVECSQIAEAANYALVHENGTNRVYRWTGGK